MRRALVLPIAWTSHRNFALFQMPIDGLGVPTKLVTDHLERQAALVELNRPINLSCTDDSSLTDRCSSLAQQLADRHPLHPVLSSQVATALPVVIVSAVLTEAGLRKQYVSEQTIAHQRNLIRRYVPSAVATSIESGHGESVGVPQRRRVTALSSDVAGFTALADRLDPESLSQIVSEYVGAMSEVIEGQGGVVTEFAGDGLMAIFGAPNDVEPEDQVHRALGAATAMHARLKKLNESWFRLGTDQPLMVRIGINTGVLSVGTFGSDGRGTYTAIGLQMNIAARIQAHCEPGATLLSNSSWHLVKDQVPCESLDTVNVKGVHFPISVYAPQATVGSP